MFKGGLLGFTTTARCCLLVSPHYAPARLSIFFSSLLARISGEGGEINRVSWAAAGWLRQEMVKLGFFVLNILNMHIALLVRRAINYRLVYSSLAFRIKVD